MSKIDYLGHIQLFVHCDKRIQLIISKVIGKMKVKWKDFKRRLPGDVQTHYYFQANIFPDLS